MEKKRNIPKLRFPDFQDLWKLTLFGKVFTFRSTNSYSRENLNYVTGSVKNIHYGDIHTKFQTLFDITKEYVPFINEEFDLTKLHKDNYCKGGDLILADASEDYADVGKSIEIVNLNGENVVAGLHTIHARPESSTLFNGFIGHLMQSEKVRLQVKTIAQGSKVLSISPKSLSEITICFPKPLEQQKIALFLTAVDNRLQLLKTKKTLLEQYKKGVMQKIFSQELRCQDEEGKDYPKWGKKKLSEIFSIFNGYAFPSKSSAKNGVLWVKIADIGICEMKTDNVSYLPVLFSKTHEKFMLRKGDYVVALTRPVLNGRLKIARINDYFDSSLLNQRAGKIVSHNNTSFVYYLLQLKWIINAIENNISGTDPPNLSPNALESIIVEFPQKSEQTKIANFLSAIDERISCCSLQIDKTALYKKGLLQKMFC